MKATKPKSESSLPNAKEVAETLLFEIRSGRLTLEQFSAAVQVDSKYLLNSLEHPISWKSATYIQKYVYYAKVELMTTESSPDKAAGVMKDFLRSALPEIEKTLPDWNSLPH